MSQTDMKTSNTQGESPLKLFWLLRSVARVSALGCIVALVVLSWLPRNMEQRTGLPGQLEHVMAYAGTGFFAAFGFSRTRQVLMGLALLAAILEVGQLWIPGRTSQLIDFMASSAGAAFGTAIGRGALRSSSGQPLWSRAFSTR
jgi:VanZ family protein